MLILTLLLFFLAFVAGAAAGALTLRRVGAHDDLLRGAIAIEPLCPLEHGRPKALYGKRVG